MISVTRRIYLISLSLPIKGSSFTFPLTSRIMQKEYQFYIPPLFDGIDELQNEFEVKLKDTAVQSRKTYIDLIKDTNSTAAYEAASNGKYQDFISK